ncbi:hypothetical protein TrRE_jg6541 [Triparma retinervis]|uniref:RRM domain-containing protein n=1 Tax=Triparma retinervis TaxID=2557542 RepID=A0A9W6ZGM5_9STRA|nr:hypothetical protein TrRE_jg6541 [Triparma retinervis]
MEGIFEKLKKLREDEATEGDDVDEVCFVMRNDSDCEGSSSENEVGPEEGDEGEGSLSPFNESGVFAKLKKLKAEEEKGGESDVDEIVYVMAHESDSEGEGVEETGDDKKETEKETEKETDEDTKDADNEGETEEEEKKRAEKKAERKARKAEKIKLKKEKKRAEREAKEAAKKASAKDDDGSESDDDDETLAALKQWDNSKSMAEEKIAETATQSLSVYVSQISYDATEDDVRKHFLDANCNVSSVRLVYNKRDGNSFRGVAFVDVSDKDSFDKALDLSNKEGPKGRKIKVLPTKTEAELSNIVRERETRLFNMRREGKELRDEIRGNAKGSKKTRRDKGEKRKRGGGDTDAKGKDGEPKKNSKKDEEGDHTLTKKQRARKAAILAQRRRR